MTTAQLFHFFHHPITSFCASMLLTDSPELAHLLKDQASSSEHFYAPAQSKMVCLKWIPISETKHRGTGSRDIHLFLHDPDNWMEIMLVQYLLGLSIHMLLNLVRLTRQEGLGCISQQLKESWWKACVWSSRDWWKGSKKAVWGAHGLYEGVHWSYSFC